MVGIFIGNTAPSKIFVGGSEVASVWAGDTKVRPTTSYKTFTISWTEKSNMSSGWTYSDDAAGLTAGSTAFDEFFGYSAVLLGTNGVEIDEITQEDSGGAGKLNLQKKNWALTGRSDGANVMIKFPLLGIKMTKSGSTVTLSITDNPNAAGFQYYAHCTGTLSNPGTPKSALYLGAFQGSRVNGTSITTSGLVMKSWATKTNIDYASPMGDATQDTFCYCAERNNNNTGFARRWNITGYYQREFINALYIMKYGNPDGQSVIGKGYTTSGNPKAPGDTITQTNATYGTSSLASKIRLFGLEDRWGNCMEWVGGAYTDGNGNLCVQLSGYSGQMSGGESTGVVLSFNNRAYCLSSIAGDNKAMFGPKGTVNNYSYNTYYCDSSFSYANGFATAGGTVQQDDNSGPFQLVFAYSTSTKARYIGARLMYL